MINHPDRAIIYKDSTGHWRYRIVAANGEIIAASQSYARKNNCIVTAEKHFPQAVVEIDYGTEEAS